MADQDDESDDSIDQGLQTQAQPAPQSPAPLNPDLKAYLQNRQQQLKGAQDQARRNEMLTGLARANAYLTAGLAHSNQAVNDAPFKDMDASDQQPVTDVLSAQKAQGDELKNQQAMLSTQKQIGDSDPKSPASIAAKNLVKRLYPGKFSDEDLANLSAADLNDKIMKPLELDEKIKEHKDEMASRAADRQALFAGKKAEKDAADHEKYVQHIEDSEKGWRSDPASQRFDNMLSATASGKSMIDQYRGHEDDMPIQDIHALVADRLKAISGATPTEKEIEAQMPPSLRGAAYHPIDTLLGHQHPAEAGDFVRNIDKGFQEMEQTARAGLKHRQETVANSPRLTQDERARLVNIGVPEPVYQQFPPDVVKFAKEHQMTPQQAQAIKDIRTPKTANNGYAYGGTVQPPGFRPMRQPHMPAVKMPHAPKAPHEVMPAMDKPMTQPAQFACGGTVHNYQQGGMVPGKDQVPYDSPANDTVPAKVSPNEIVLPLSVTQSKDPALSAYLFVKQEMAKKNGMG